jgi:hypothetical protein
MATSTSFRLLSAESALHPRLIRIAVDYAATHPDDVLRRVDRNVELAERNRAASRNRSTLLS